MPFRPVGPSGGFLAPTESNVAPYFFPGKFLPSCGLACLAFDVPESHLVSWSVDSTLPCWPLYLGKCRSFLYRLRTVTTWKGREVSSRRGEEPWDPHHQRGRGGPPWGCQRPQQDPSETRGCADARLCPSALVAGKKDASLVTARGYGSGLPGDVPVPFPLCRQAGSRGRLLCSVPAVKGWDRAGLPVLILPDPRAASHPAVCTGMVPVPAPGDLSARVCHPPASEAGSLVPNFKSALFCQSRCGVWMPLPLPLTWDRPGLGPPVLLCVTVFCKVSPEKSETSLSPLPGAQALPWEQWGCSPRPGVSEQPPFL